MSLQVRLDATNIYPRCSSPAYYYSIFVRDCQTGGYKQGIQIDPYLEAAYIKPYQLQANPHNNASIVRQGKSLWSLTSSHWDEVTNSYEKWLLSDGTDETITCNTVFPKNCGFNLKFKLFGLEDDSFEDALIFTFGQWELTIDSSGFAKLRHTDDSAELIRATGYLVPSDGDRITNKTVELYILPLGKHRLGIRSRSGGGFYHTLPEAECVSGMNLVDSGRVTLKASHSRVMFELTQLLFPTSGTYMLETPVYRFPTPPLATQDVDWTVHYEIDKGGVTTSLRRSDGTSFDPDGIETDYKLRMVLVPDPTGKTSPIVFGAVIKVANSTAEDLDDPTDITTDVSSLVIDVGEKPSQTVAKMTVRNPTSHLWYTACNRLCKITADSQVVLNGILRIPPKYTRKQCDHGIWEVEVVSLAKFLEEACLPGKVDFANIAHTDAIKWLLQMGGLVATDYSVPDDNQPLIDERHKGESMTEESALETSLADTPIHWIDKICAQTGWQFVDGYDDSGNFIFKYQDPLTLSETVKHNFYFQTSSCLENYQRILRDWSPYAVEPECNELYVCALNRYGQPIAGRYWDKTSQDSTLAEELRPPNWLGIRRIAIIPLEITTTTEYLQGLALRLSHELCQVREFVTFEADYPVGLWVGDVISVTDDNSLTYYYRITGLKNIVFHNEFESVPLRTASYEAVKVNVTV